MDTQNIKSKEAAPTIGEMVTEDYRKAEVFGKFGIDFCCGGKEPLAETCNKQGIDIQEVTKALNELDGKTSQSGSHDYDSWDLDFLADYIVNTHHKYVEAALPQLDVLSAKVANVHGHSHSEVIEIAKLYNAIADELRMHMRKEEDILFPYIKQMMHAKRNNEPLVPSPFGTIKNPIDMMEMEHESAGGSLQKIHDLSNDYTTPPEACNTFRVLYGTLKDFETDLHRHIHLENHILFPKAIELEAELLS